MDDVLPDMARGQNCADVRRDIEMGGGGMWWWLGNWSMTFPRRIAGHIWCSPE